MYKKQKRNVTLIEMMIVMFLIAMIIGVVAYNYQGSLEEGRAFKSKANKEKLETVLTIESDGNLGNQNWRDLIDRSPLVQNKDELKKDGWGEEFEVRTDDNGKIIATSAKYVEFTRRHPNSKFALR